MSKQQVIEFLNNRQGFAKTLGLHRMESLMSRLGNPQERLKIVHVAGTNGKGSVCAMLTSVLMEAGYTVGLFTSPHLIDYNERIQIQRIPINDTDFGDIGMQIKYICEQMVSDGEEMPTVFECLTAMAFMYFAINEIDAVVLETGIGGTYDATNIIKKPLASIITSIGKDHMSILGDTIEAIAYEKAGIIKENCPTILYNSENAVYNIVNSICKKKNSLLFTCRGAVVSEEQYNIDGTSFSVKSPYVDYQHVYLQLVGKYQISNAITVLTAVEMLRRYRYNISRDAVYKGLKKAKWAGRMEVIRQHPLVIFDGAHNEQSAKAFICALLNIAKDRKVHLLLGVLKDKDYRSMLTVLLPLAHKVIVTQCSYPRALPAHQLYEEISNNALANKASIIVEEDLSRAYEIGCTTLHDQDILCCVGSLYLIGELKKLEGEKNKKIGE